MALEDHCLTIVMVTFVSTVAIFLGSLPILCLLELLHNYCIRRKTRESPIGGPITLKDGRKPTAADFIILKVHEVQLLEHSYVNNHDVKGREHIIGLACTLCSKDLGGVDKSSLTVTSQCFHIFHTACFSKKLRCRNACPSCNRAVDTKEMKELVITSKPSRVAMGNQVARNKTYGEKDCGLIIWPS